jgi:hypothetical protein
MGLLDYLRATRPIGPEAFALNPDNWPNSWPAPLSSTPSPARGLDGARASVSGAPR